MKLLFDQNISPGLVYKLKDLYPQSSPVFLLGLDRSSDREVWEFAKKETFAIVTKDVDFVDMSILFGFPPKVVWIRRGNCRTTEIEIILRNHLKEVAALVQGEETGVLTLF